MFCLQKYFFFLYIVSQGAEIHNCSTNNDSRQSHLVKQIVPLLAVSQLWNMFGDCILSYWVCKNLICNRFVHAFDVDTDEVEVSLNIYAIRKILKGAIYSGIKAMIKLCSIHITFILHSNQLSSFDS